MAGSKSNYKCFDSIQQYSWNIGPGVTPLGIWDVTVPIISRRIYCQLFYVSVGGVATVDFLSDGVIVMTASINVPATGLPGLWTSGESVAIVNAGAELITSENSLTANSNFPAACAGQLFMKVEYEYR